MNIPAFLCSHRGVREEVAEEGPIFTPQGVFEVVARTVCRDCGVTMHERLELSQTYKLVRPDGA